MQFIFLMVQGYNVESHILYRQKIQEFLSPCHIILHMEDAHKVIHLVMTETQSPHTTNRSKIKMVSFITNL